MVVGSGQEWQEQGMTVRLTVLVTQQTGGEGWRSVTLVDWAPHLNPQLCMLSVGKLEASTPRAANVGVEVSFAVLLKATVRALTANVYTG